jgi:hypothetical protein
MIVSSQLDIVKPYARTRRVLKGIQYTPSEETYPLNALPPQKPTINLFKKIRKPVNDNSNMSTTPGRIPLKSLQYGSHMAGSSLFDAPVPVAMMPLKVPIVRASGTIVGDMTTEINIPFSRGLDFAQGIRPSIRELKPSEIFEPAPLNYRPAEMKMTHSRDVDVGYYDVGMDVLQMEITGKMGKPMPMPSTRGMEAKIRGRAYSSSDEDPM